MENGTDFWCPPYTSMVKVLEPGTWGSCKIDRVTVTEEDARFANLRASMRGMWNMTLYPGDYIRLLIDGDLFMSDTPYERRTNREFIRNANGRVLIAGLGIGMIVVPLLDVPAPITEVVVVEKSQDVIDAVLPQLREYLKDKGVDRLNVVNADIFDYKDKDKFDTIYFDIWPGICGDNYTDMKKLHRSFARRLNRDNSRAFMESWERFICRKLNKGGW